MPLMLLLLAGLMSAVVWGFFHASPAGTPRLPLLVCNGAILALAVGLALASALPLHADALAKHPDQRFMALYLAIMAGGSAFMIALALGGLLRNLVLFPPSRRRA